MTSRRLLVAGVLGSVLVARGGLVSWLGVAVLGAAWWSSRRFDLRHQRAAAALWALPLLAAIFMAVHFWRVRKDGGISGPL